MSKLQQKECPRCDAILERIYHRERKDNGQTYSPIGHMCPNCREDMLVMDVNFRKKVI
jgi:hypothetical protein